MRIKLAIFTTVLACGFASTPSGAADRAGLQIEIQSPAADFVAIAGEKTVDFESAELPRFERPLWVKAVI